MPLPCKTWYYKECNKNYKSTWNVESNYILQPQKYLILFIKRFRYTNNNVTKDRYSIPMDTIVMLCPLNLVNGLLLIIMDRLYIPVIILYLSIVARKKPNNILLQQQPNYGVWNYWWQKTPLLHMLYFMNWLTYDRVLGSSRRVGVCMALAHPLYPINSRSRNKHRNLWGGRCVSPWWPLFRFSPETLC